MNRKLRLVSTFSALAASLFLWGCENLSNVTQPLTPQEASFAKGGHGHASRLKLVSQPGWAESGAEYFGLIGRDGGVVGTDAYRLDVPRNAVIEPTLFVIGAAPGADGEIAIQATATSCDLGSAEACYAEEQSNDVGAQGFRVPVSINIGFNPGGGAKQWRGITMVLIDDDDRSKLTPVPTRVMMAQKEVRGLADHFSLYGIAWP